MIYWGLTCGSHDGAVAVYQDGEILLKRIKMIKLELLIYLEINFLLVFIF